MPITAARLRVPAVVLLLALAAAQCGRSPESLTGTSPVLSKGAVPWGGNARDAGDSDGPVNAHSIGTCWSSSMPINNAVPSVLSNASARSSPVMYNVPVMRGQG